MFKAKVTPEEKNRNNGNIPVNSHNFISKGTIIKGEINCEGTIRIDGTLEGSINCESKILVGETGVIDGDITCHTADISGNLIGTVNVDEVLYLRETAVIQGEVITNKLVVDSGALLKGTCSMPLTENATTLVQSRKTSNGSAPVPSTANGSNLNRKKQKTANA